MRSRGTLLIALLIVVAGSARAATTSPRVTADSALAALRAASNAEARQVARARLEDVALRVPGDREVWHDLAEGRLQCGFSQLAREAWEHVLAVDSTDARAWEGVGDTWKHDWVLTMDRGSLASAANAYYHSTANDGRRAHAWIELGTLLYETGDGPAAGVAASRALEVAPSEPRAMLLGGLLAYRGGKVAMADSLFGVAVPRLPPDLAAHFTDVRPLLSPADAERYETMRDDVRPEYERRFWSASDPDPTAPWNVARLEYRARVAYALLLMEDRPRSFWDARAEMLARYGMPRAAAYEPPGSALAWTPMRPAQRTVDPRTGAGRPIGEAAQMWFETHAQVMAYPQLGIRAQLVDYTLRGEYQLPRVKDHDPDPRPDTALVRALGLDLTGGGRGVFPKLPPLAEPHDLAVNVARFEGGNGPRLLAYVRTPGAPADSLVATLVVVDSSEHEVRRASAKLAPSTCDAATHRSGEFAFDLPAGPYRVAFSVTDRKGGRGVERRVASLAPATPGLTISDLVPVCSTPDMTLDRSTVRLDPMLPVAIEGRDALQAYFEVYRLRPGSDGLSDFEYEYEVHGLGADRRPWFRKLATLGQRPALVSVRSSQSGAGPVRRQFIHVPGAELSPGRYRLTLRVRDRVNGAVAVRELEFDKAR